MNGSLCFDLYFSNQPMALAKRNERQVKPNLHVSPPLRPRVLPSPLRRSREHLYHVGFRQSIVAASRDTGFFRAGTEPARNALHFPDPRLFAIAISLHLNSFGTPRFDIATDLPHFRLWFSSDPLDGTATYVELPRCGMQLTTTRLEKRRSFHGHLQSKYSHSRRRPSDCLSKY